MPRVLGRSPNGAYTIQTDSGAVVQSAVLPPGLDEPGVLNVPGMSPPPTAAPPQGPAGPLDPFSAQMRDKLRANSGIPETMTPEEMAAGAPGTGKGGGGASLVDYKPGMGSARGGGPPSGGGYSPARVIPGKLQLAQQTTQQAKYDPEALKAVRDDQKAVSDSADKVADAQADQAEKVARFKEDQNMELGIADAKAQNHERSRQDQIQLETNRLQQLQEQFASGNFVDEGYEKAGGRIAATIGMALANMGNAAMKQNMGVGDQIERQVNRYIAEARDRARGKVEDQKTLLGQMRTNFQDDRQADAATRMTLLDRAGKQLDAMVSSGAPENIRRGAQQARDELKLKFDQANADFTKSVVEKHEVMTRPAVVGGAPKSQEVENKLLVKDLNGNTYVADSPESAEKARTNHGLVSQALDAAHEMRNIANKSAGDKLDPTSPLGQQFAFAQERYTNAMNTLQGQGVVRGEDVERYQKYSGGQFGLATAKMADELAQKARFGYDTQVKAIADTDAPAKREWYTDPKTGTVRRRAVYDLGRAGTRGAVDFTPQGGGQ